MADSGESRPETRRGVPQSVVVNSLGTEAAGGGPPAAVREKGLLGTVKMFLELVKFEHSVFALPYAFIGALYGVEGDWPSVVQLVWITTVMVGARAFAFVLNRATDEEIDARNPRTAGRAVPAGLVKAWELWVFAAAMLVVYLLGVWQLDPIVRWLWPIPLVAFLVYPYTKRFTSFCHYWLGLCLGLAPAGAWIAVGGPANHPTPWVLGAAVMLWTAGFDMIYATQDVGYDRRDGLHSMPADLGVAPALLQTRLAHTATVGLLVLGGYLVEAGWPWYAGVGVASLLLVYENSIVSARDLSRVGAAFFTANGVIAIVVFVGALGDRLMG